MNDALFLVVLLLELLYSFGQVQTGGTVPLHLHILRNRVSKGLRMINQVTLHPLQLPPLLQRLGYSLLGCIFKLKKSLLFMIDLFLILSLDLQCMGKMAIDFFPHVELLLRAMTTMTEDLLIGRHPFLLIGRAIDYVNKYIVVFLSLIFRKELQSLAWLSPRIRLNEGDRVLFMGDRTFRLIVPHLQVVPGRRLFRRPTLGLECKYPLLLRP